MKNLFATTVIIGIIVVQTIYWGTINYYLIYLYLIYLLFKLFIQCLIFLEIVYQLFNQLFYWIIHFIREEESQRIFTVIHNFYENSFEIYFLLYYPKIIGFIRNRLSSNNYSFCYTLIFDYKLIIWVQLILYHFRCNYYCYLKYK